MLKWWAKEFLGDLDYFKYTSYLYLNHFPNTPVSTASSYSQNLLSGRFNYFLGSVILGDDLSRIDRENIAKVNILLFWDNLQVSLKLIFYLFIVLS